MGFRFRKRIKVMPGVTLNVSKGGVSTTVGRRGLSMTLGKRSRVNVGASGTGLSYSAPIKGASGQPLAAPAPPSRAWAMLKACATFILLYAAIVAAATVLQEQLKASGVAEIAAWVIPSAGLWVGFWGARRVWRNSMRR